MFNWFLNTPLHDTKFGEDPKFIIVFPVSSNLFLDR